MVTTTKKLHATTEQVWLALTDIEKQKEWYFDIPLFNTEVGTTFEFYESEAKQYLHRCEVLEVIPNQILRHTWTHPNESKGTSVVTWKLEENGENTIVTLTHEGLDSFADAGENFKPENFQMGWDAIVKGNLRNFLGGIKRLKFEKEINASAEKIWSNMWENDSYSVWTAPFCEGSYYKGKLEQGGRIHFLAPDGSGMYSDVMFLKSPTNVVFQHIGEVVNFEEKAIDEATEQWTGSMEIYSINKLENGKHLLVAEMDCTEPHIKYMSEKFPLGLEIVKDICEQ